MMYSETTALKKIRAMTKRIRIVQGGSGAGKSIAILLILIDWAQRPENAGKTVTIVSENLPHLKRGVLKDCLSILENHGYYREANHNKTDNIYVFDGTGARMEFFGADQPEKVRGPRRDVLWLNEGNAIHYETYTQLAIRTNEFIFIDHNPTSEYWALTELKPRDDAEFIILNYKDNESLPESVVKELESRKHNKYFWDVYGRGVLGETEAKIYRDWKIIDELPHEARLERRGLDFGYTNDPTAIVDVYRYDGGLILDEICYTRGMSNRQIADLLNAQPDRGVLTIADSSEPKSIDEISSHGINIVGSQKGPGSVFHGIQKVQDQRISVTKKSVNLIKEYRGYAFITDKNGKIINEPESGNDHALDSCRYAIETMTEHPLEAVQIPPSNPTAYKYGASRRMPHPFP